MPKCSTRAVASRPEVALLIPELVAPLAEAEDGFGDFSVHFEQLSNVEFNDQFNSIDIGGHEINDASSSSSEEEITYIQENEQPMMILPSIHIARFKLTYIAISQFFFPQTLEFFESNTKGVPIV